MMRDEQSAGSSPLARGLLGFYGGVGGAPRIIPARAGFTRRHPPRPRSSRDHPRSRGVYDHRTLAVSVTDGSSPLARGLRPASPRPSVRPGIIPARAGFTSQPAHRRKDRPDHPRSRGVYSIARVAFRFVAGSSPLARGLRTHHSEPGIGSGIIPARAGFTAARQCY